MLSIRKWDFQESRHYSMSQGEFEAEHKLNGFDNSVIRSIKIAFGRVLFSKVAKRVMVSSTLEKSIMPTIAGSILLVWSACNLRGAVKSESRWTE